MPDERAMRFGYLLSEIEIKARSLLDGKEPDLMGAVLVLLLHTAEAAEIAAEISREALDRVTDDA